jgi:CheY-like chemotaxis protein
MTLTKAVKAGRWPVPDILIQDSMKTPCNILVIDDDEIFIFLTRKMLQSTGMVESISVCRSATEAIELLQIENNNWPDVILLDLNMPEMNGWEFLQQYQLLLKHVTTHPRLYVVSSSIAENDTERAKKIKGVDGYIAKPLTGDGIKKMLREAASISS